MGKSNKIQPENWFDTLPRQSYKKLEKINVNNDWFEVYKLPKKVYAIYEPRHFQEVISFLILGEQKSILLDTGLGIGNIKEVVDVLYPGKIEVINSHCHFDHVGENHKFSKTSIYNDSNAIERLKKGYSHDELKEHLDSYLIHGKLPKSFNREKYYIPPVTPNTVNDGDKIDLGNRKLHIIHTPGHSSDSIMLLDKENRILFTGDTFYPAALYAHFNSNFYGSSVFDTYLDSLIKIEALKESIDYLYCSHNEPIVNPNILTDVVDAFKQIKKGIGDYKIVDKIFREYLFNGFSIIVPDIR